MAHTDVVSLNAPLLQQGLALFGLELFLCAVDPAAAQPDGGSSVHQVAYHKAAVLHTTAGIGIRQHHQNGGGTVHGVARVAHHGGIHPGELGAGLGILHHHDLCALAVHGAGGKGACAQNGFQLLFRDLLRLVGAAAAAGLKGM